MTCEKEVGLKWMQAKGPMLAPILPVSLLSCLWEPQERSGKEEEEERETWK